MANQLAGAGRSVVAFADDVIEEVEALDVAALVGAAVAADSLVAATAAVGAAALVIVLLR